MLRSREEEKKREEKQSSSTKLFVQEREDERFGLCYCL